MGDRIKIDGLEIDRGLYQLVDQEIAPGTGVDSAHFWQSLADIHVSLGGANRALMEKRDQIQQQLDAWHKSHFGNIDLQQYRAFLVEIGYLVAEAGPFQVTTENVDDEVAMIAPMCGVRSVREAARIGSSGRIGSCSNTSKAAPARCPV